MAADGGALGRQIAALKRAFNKNAQQRTRHAEAPQKWANSEVAVHDAVQTISAVAASPQLFKTFVQRDGIVALVHVLGHPNADLVAAALRVFAELCDPEGEGTNLEPYKFLLDALISAGVFQAACSVLLEHAGSTDSDSASTACAPCALTTDEGVAGILSAALDLFEHASELKPGVEFAVDITRNLGKLLGLLLKDSVDASTEKEKTDDGKRKLTQVDEAISTSIARAVDTLALLLHDAPECRAAFVEENGLDALLRVVAVHVKETGGEALENTRNALAVLCDVLLGGEKAQLMFIECGGVEQLLKLVRERVGLRDSALKVLDFACMSCRQAVAKAFASGAVGILFAVFSKLKLGQGSAARSNVEHVLGILFSMFRFADNDEQHDRLLFKFLQRSGKKQTKIDQLFSVYRHFANRICQIDNAHASFLLDGEGSSDLRKLGDPETVEKAYMGRLDAGLFVVQLAGIIATHILAFAPLQSLQSVQTLMSEHGVTWKGVLNSVSEYTNSIEAADGSGSEMKSREEERTRLSRLVEAAEQRLEPENEGSSSIRG